MTNMTDQSAQSQAMNITHKYCTHMLRYAELEQYTSLGYKPTSRKHCDEIVTKPTIFIKLDAGMLANATLRYLTMVECRGAPRVSTKISSEREYRAKL